MTENRTDSRQAGYSRQQIMLHWLIAALVAAQLLTGDDMQRVQQMAAEGQTPQVIGFLLSSTHALSGGLIFVVMLVRLRLKIRSDAPASRTEMPAILVKTARWVHWLLYGVLLLLPVTGIATWVTGSTSLSMLHSGLVRLLLALLLLHIGAAVVHAIRGDGVWQRIMLSRR